MDELESKKENRNDQKHRFDPELLKKGFRCDLDQYEMLKRCSDKKDMTEWNKWRLSNPGEDIFLQGANLNTFYLQFADLRKANLQGAGLLGAKMQHASLLEADLQGVNLVGSQLQGVILWGVNLQGVNFLKANLQGAELNVAKLQNSNLSGVQLQSADLTGAKIQGADFSHAIVDGGTLIWEPEVNRYRKGKSFTNFSGVGLDEVRIDPATKQLLEYNIRRMNWEEWYKEHPKLKYLVKPFWLMSDYGLSTGRIVAVFLGVVLIFANIYYHWGRIAPPGIIENIFVDRNGAVVPWWLVPLRTLYFSVAAMIGFSEVSPNIQSIWGHILIMLQAILGYVLLAALVTRFAVLFTAGGPAGKFANEKIATEGTENTEKI